MKIKIKKIIAIVFLLTFLSISGCGASHVSVGVGVYSPGAWGRPYGVGYYPPVGIGVGFPIY